MEEGCKKNIHKKDEIQMGRELSRKYYQLKSEAALGGVERLYKTFNGKCSLHVIEEWLYTQEMYTLHKPSRMHFGHSKTLVNKIDDVWWADLVDMLAYGNENDVNKYMFTYIDIFKIWLGIPVKNKMSSAIWKFRKPLKIQTDFGGEFVCKNNKEYLKMLSIGYYTTNNETRK